jgi:hypothetical protein
MTQAGIMLAEYVRNDTRGKFHVQNIFCVMWEGLKLTVVRILDVVFGQSGWSQESGFTPATSNM